MSPKKQNRSTSRKQDEAERRRESGEPGGGAGRRDEVRGSGVYPAFADNIPEDAKVRMAGEWAQKAGGQVGGASELNPIDLGIEYDEEGNPISPELHKRNAEEEG